MSSDPLYEQLAARIGQEIDNGKYARGARLPSEAALAEQFGVSRGRSARHSARCCAAASSRRSRGAARS